MENFLPSANFWLCLGVLFLILEVTAVTGIGFLFAGFGAMTFGILLSYQIIEAFEWSLHILYFFSFTIMWAGLLWYPLKQFLNNKKTDYSHSEYSNIVGTSGESAEDLLVGKLGAVKWSGSIMRATISASSNKVNIPKGTTIWVHKVEDGVLHVDIDSHHKHQNP